MEHSCHKCGISVEDGVPFCPQCNAPQIRVASVETLQLSEPEAGFPTATSPDGTKLQWPYAWRAAALAGLTAALVMLIPFGGSVVGLVAAGGLAVALYQRRMPSANLTATAGARLGALGGVIGFVIFTILTALGMALFGGGDKLRASLLEAVERASNQSPDPHAREFLETFRTPSGLAVLLVLSFAALAVVFVLCSGVGGALGAKLLHRKESS